MRLMLMLILMALATAAGAAEPVADGESGQPALLECVPTEVIELTCDDGLDNDCDGLIDYEDFDCGDYCGPLDCCPLGAPCQMDAICCSNSCKGPQGRKTCR